MNNYYTPEKISSKMSKTPEGFLMCYDVPVARIGSQDYAKEEIAGLEKAIEPGANGMISVSRTPDELFRPETLATLNGKDVVDEHPDDDPDRMFDVEPDNWRYLTRGTVLNPRRGTGSDSDVILCDLLIKDASAIKEVEDGKREVSGGYRAQYFKTAAGKAEQRNIFFNHVALVEAGRCGPRCSIRDHKCNKEPEMAKPQKSFIDRLVTAWKTKDEKAFNEAMEEAKEKVGDADESGVPTSANGVPEVHIHNHMGPGPAGATTTTDDAEPGAGEEELPEYFKKHVERNNAQFGEVRDGMKKLGDQMAECMGAMKGSGGTVDADPNEKIADELAEEAPEGVTKDAAKKSRDSVNLEHSFGLMISDSEVILPGVSIPVFTRDAAPSVTYPSMCKHRRTVLELAYVQPTTRGIIDEVLAGKSFDLQGMTCTKVRDMFSSVATARRAANRASAFNDNGNHNDGRRRDDGASEIPRDNAGMNDYLAKHYGGTAH